MKKQITKMVTSVVLMAIIYAGSAYAAPIYPAADGYMRDNPLNGAVEFGPYTSNLLAQYVPNYNSGAGLEDRGFVEFDISALSGTLNADLLLTEWDPRANADETVSLYGYYGANADGTISQVDWTGGTFVGQMTTTGTIGIQHSLDVSVILNNAVDAGADYLGFTIIDPNPPIVMANHYSSFVTSSQVGSTPFSTYVNVVDQPTLDVNVIPEPTTIALLGLGTLLMRGKRS